MSDRIKVLIVDDFQIMHKTLSLMLKGNSNIEVVGTAQNGIEAYDKSKLKQVDLVLMDIEMPFMDGIQATKTILESNPEIKVLGITFHEEVRLLAQIIVAGAHGYLIKPVSITQLLEAINAVMDGKYYLGFYTNMKKPNLSSFN
jgi:DNA-binding NarL/FixJ family response regulator